MKRLFDIVVAGSILICLLPILMLVGLVIKITDNGPIFFRQKRIGLGAVPFEILKFRSMVVNADKLGGYSTADADPRITKVGHFLRRSSLDELPQLINVLRGDMSLVGPRPDVPNQKKLYSKEDLAMRCSVRPGITGLAQALKRSDVTQEERLQIDLDYIRKSNLLFDIWVLILTVKQVTFKGGN